MATDTTYSGWTNYETWAVKLWIDNDQGSQELASETVADAWELPDDSWQAGQSLRDVFAEYMPDLGSSMFSDLLTSAWGNVDWAEIAESIHEDEEGE